MAAAEREFTSNAEFYEFVDTIAGRLRRCDRFADAERLHALIHKVAWTTSTELFGELRIALQQMQDKNKPADADLASDIADAIQLLASALSYRGCSRRFRVPHQKT
jgi:hypothetical protein